MPPLVCESLSTHNRRPDSTAVFHSESHHLTWQAMQNETLRPESTPSGLDNFRPLIDTARLAHAPDTLVNKYGRHVTYVRLSITDRCDFRCTYCMAEEMTFLPRHEVMSLEECLQLATVFVSLGVNKLRITGGEPLVRKDAMWLIERLGALPGLDNLVITTNGSQLDRFARRAESRRGQAHQHQPRHPARQSASRPSRGSAISPRCSTASRRRRRRASGAPS